MSEVQQMMQDLGRRAKTAAASLAYAPAAQKTAALMAAADAVISLQARLLDLGLTDSRGASTQEQVKSHFYNEYV